MEIENGGAGPRLGLLKLKEWNKELVNEKTDHNLLSTSFPYVKDWNTNRPDGEDSDLYYQSEAFAKWSYEYFDNKHISGSIRLSHYGCGIFYFLVVTGAEKGNIWVDDRCNDCGIYPAISKMAKAKMNFSEWYQEWLTESITFCK